MKRIIAAWIRNMTMKEGILSSSARDEKAQSVYEMYYHVRRAAEQSGRTTAMLAINRGEKEKIPDREDRSAGG